MANKYTTRNLLEHNFDENNYANLVEAAQNKANAVSAVANYGDPKYARQQDIESAIDAKLNQGKFSYDINGDALYQQYKDNYINQGKQAMMDTMGQAAAMTGGYGNSYAATVGNQTYQGYLQNLNNMIPQLQQMALDRYNAESNRLTENLNILNADKANYLSEWELGLNKRLADRDYYGTDYANLYKNTLDLYDKQFTANNEAYWNEYEAGYKAERDSIEDERYAEEQRKKAEQQLFENDLALKNYDLNKRQVEAAEDETKYKNTIEQLESDIKNKYIPIDKLHVDEKGILTSVDGYTLAGAGNNETGNNETGAVYSDAKISGFNGNKNNNFTIKIGDKSYNLENEGEVDDDDIIKILNKSGAKEKQIVTYNGNAYIMYSGKYYKMGNQETWFGLGNNGNYSNLLKRLQK